MTYAWFDAGDGRSVYRRIPGPPPLRSDLPCPMIAGDTMDPVQSAADGKVYTSKSGIRASYLPSGNPEGARFEEVGNDPARLRLAEKPKADRSAVRDAIERANASLK